jgi:hypothetical protein
MTRVTSLRPEFVQFIPGTLDDGVLYVSLEHCTVTHRCCCGCGNEVVTPLDPTQWRLIYDGRVSLEPSVGSWNLPCRSHYWVNLNTVRWAEPWTDARIAAARAAERQRTAQYYSSESQSPPASTAPPPAPGKSCWLKLWEWFAR